MSSLSELIIREKTTAERLHQAEAWAKQSVAILDKPENADAPICAQSLGVAFFNLASVLEVWISITVRRFDND